MKKALLVLTLILISSVSFAKDVYIVEIEGVITGYTEKYIASALADAAENDGVLMIKLDTPGGILESTRGIVQTLLESKTPVITFVSPQGARAGSAGTFIVLASHYAAMAEGTNIGAAHPVNITGKDFEGHMAQKIENDTVAFMKSIAEKRDRNTEAAVSTVTESKSYTSAEALELKLVDGVVNTDREAADRAGEKLGFATGELKVIQAGPLQKIAFFLSDPNVLVLLLFIGILAIILEFKMPGTFVFAVLGITAIVMFLMGINIIPVNSLALLLIIAGLGLLGAELFIPSFGLLTLASVVSLGAGLYLLFATEENMGIGVSLWLIGAVLGLILSLVLILGRMIFRDFRSRPSTGINALEGKTCKVVKWEGKSGQVFVHGEIWNAVSETMFETGDKVRVISADGMTLTVENINV